MNPSQIRHHRLTNQHLVGTTFTTAQQVVSSMVAMQAQEFAHAKWAIGLRSTGLDDAAVEKSFNQGAILRTHILRPTWHFVSPHDIGWLRALTAPRIQAGNGAMLRKFELSSVTLTRSNDILADLLRGGNYMTRAEIMKALERKKIIANGIRLSYIMMQAELDGVICSGPRRGKEFTYALLTERAPRPKPFDREEALSDLALRYFRTRGPATLLDFTHWSGLTMKEAKESISLLSKQFHREFVGDREYIVAPSSQSIAYAQPTFLMPDYDEYGMSYRDRSAIVNPAVTIKSRVADHPTFAHCIIVDGVISGYWSQTVGRNSITIHPTFSPPLSKRKRAAAQRAMTRYCSFFGKSLGASDSQN